MTVRLVMLTHFMVVPGLRYRDAIHVGVKAEIHGGYPTSFCVGCRNLCTLWLKPQ